MSTLELLHLERERRHRERLRVDGPKWDWYGPDCGCPQEMRKADGGCREHERARPKQRPPEGDWQVWLIRAGRSFGKTRTGAEWIRHMAEHGPRNGQYALIGETAADVRDIMLEGPSGIMTISPPWFRPTYEPSKRRLSWPNGVKGLLYSAQEPNYFRGPQFHGGWLDEFAKWSNIEECYDNLQFGMRLVSKEDPHWIPRLCVTTTPLPLAIIKRLIKDPGTVVVNGSMYENAANVAKSFIDKIRAQFEGTRFGRQEIHGEILEDAPGALWKNAVLDEHRIPIEGVPEFVRVAVAVDPSVADHTSRLDDEDTAEAGIVGGGLDDDGHGFLVADRSVRGHPQRWGTAAVNLYHELEADVLVAEVNNGGALVAALIHSIDPHVNVKMVHASRGKRIRAEPVAARYEQGKCHHVGVFPELESQLTGWVPGMKSPDRLDAMVWLFTELFEGGAPLTFGEDPFPGYRG